MFGITKIVKGYSIQTYFLYCYAIFISEDITRQRGGVTFGTPCTYKYKKILHKIYFISIYDCVLKQAQLCTCECSSHRYCMNTHKQVYSFIKVTSMGEVKIKIDTWHKFV